MFSKLVANEEFRWLGGEADLQAEVTEVEPREREFRATVDRLIKGHDTEQVRNASGWCPRRTGSE